MYVGIQDSMETKSISGLAVSGIDESIAAIFVTPDQWLWFCRVA
jgi:hypothetical protein